MTLYADTSALVKLVIDEPGRIEMERALADADRLVSVAVAFVEMCSAVAAALRQGRVAAERRDDLFASIEMVWGDTVRIPMIDSLLRRAAAMAERHRLRAYDAVHLASLVQVGGPTEVAFACWDTDLRRAARDLGYQLLPP